MTLYASQKNIQILVALLKQHGVCHAVVSPGSRNMAFVRSLQDDDYFTIYSVVDERSAAYFAIGVSLAHQLPVILSCTSGQATRNYMPGMTEAYYRGVPLVVVTADYRDDLIGQGTMQAIRQMSIPIDTAKVSVNLPLVQDAHSADQCARLVNQSLLGLSHHGTGPVHINVPIEAHWVGTVDHLPNVRPLKRFSSPADFPELRGRRVLVVVGQHKPFGVSQEAALAEFAETYMAVVYTNRLSNYHGPNRVAGSLLMESMDSRTSRACSPDLVITIGGQIGEYGLDGWLRRQSCRHWRVHEDGQIQDTFGKLESVFECTEEAFFGEYTSRKPSLAPDEGYLPRWESEVAKRTVPDTIPLSHASIARALSPRIPTDSVVHYAILSSLRNWNYFDSAVPHEGYSNVAAFGIDGCVSTFIGHSVATDRLCFLIVGDLSFYYDMNSIGIRHVNSNARILLVNNGGGGEFQLYSNAASQFGKDADHYIAAAGHYGSARGWVESMGWRYIGVTNQTDLEYYLEDFVGASDRPILMEVTTTMQGDSEAIRLIRQRNTHLTPARRLYRRIPLRTKRVARRIISR